jgi:hypothetical protein
MLLTTSSGWPLLRSHNMAMIVIDTGAKARRRVLDVIPGELWPVDDRLVTAVPQDRPRSRSSARDPWRIRWRA